MASATSSGVPKRPAGMRPDSAARILAGLQPATAYAVSAHLAGRNATVPSQ